MTLPLLSGHDPVRCAEAEARNWTRPLITARILDAERHCTHCHGPHMRRQCPWVDLPSPDPATLTKQCDECGQVKALTEFHRKRAYTLNFDPRCKPCAREHERAYRAWRRDSR